MAPFWSLATGLAPVEEDAVKLAERSLAERESVLLRHPGLQVRQDAAVDPEDLLQALTVPGGAQDCRRLVETAHRKELLGQAQSTALKGRPSWDIADRDQERTHPSVYQQILRWDGVC